jgi:hypothetical protein
MPGARHGGCALELAYYTDEQTDPRRTVTFNLHVDKNGYLAGLYVEYCWNSAPMPDSPVLIEPPFQLYGRLLNGL